MQACHSLRKPESQELSLPVSSEDLPADPSLCSRWPVGALASPKSLPHVTATRGLSFQPRGPSEEAETLACPFGKSANFALARFSQSFLTCVLGEMSARGRVFSGQLREHVPGCMLAVIKQGSR